MKTVEAEYGVSDCCRALGVSRSGYYAWCRRKPSARAEGNSVLSSEVKRVFELKQRRYGSPRITRELRRDGWTCSENRVSGLMKRNHLNATPKRRFSVSTTNSNHDLPIAPNRLADVTEIARSNQVWVGDITYISTDEGWLYLAGIMDGYSRRVVGWAMSESLATDLPLAALQMALKQRCPSVGVLHHSDRGCQYASERYRDELLASGCIPSMSRAGNCYDNAMMESFWATLKREIGNHCHFTTRDDAYRAIFQYIESFYNRERLHSSIGYFSPVDFENINN